MASDQHPSGSSAASDGTASHPDDPGASGDGSGRAPQPRIRRIVSVGIRWAFGIAVVAFGAVYIADQWNEISATLAQVAPGFLLAAFGFVAVALLTSMLSWRALWPAFGARIGLLDGARVFFVSQLGKYVPGSVWPIAAQAQMARRYHLPATSSVLLSLIAMLIGVATGLAVGLVLIPFVDASVFETYWWLLVIGLGLVATLIPPVLTWGTRLVLRVLRRPTTAFVVTGRISAEASLLQVANWVAGGLQLWLIVIALGGDPATSLLPSLAAFPLGFALGILVVPFPAGLGVREFVIALLIGAAVGDTIAVTAAIASRLLYAVADFSAAGVAMGASRIGRGPEPAGATSGR